MRIPPLDNPFIMNFGLSNPVQPFANLAITVLALHVISKLPGAQAIDASNVEQEVCEVICSPLPGEKEDIPERVCQETCKQGAKTIRSKTYTEKLVNGAWESAPPLIDCGLVCSGDALIHANGFIRAAKQYFWDGDKTKAKITAIASAAKMTCSAMSYTPVGIPGCLACCGGTKYFDFT